MNPNLEHCQAFEDVSLCLRAFRDWGICQIFVSLDDGLPPSLLRTCLILPMTLKMLMRPAS